MTIEELVQVVEKRKPLETEKSILGFEESIGSKLPEDYRQFLMLCNGGFLGGTYGTEEDESDEESIGALVHHIGGFREESHFSLESSRDCYQSPEEIRIPTSLIWIMDDPCGNAICLGVKEPHFGKVYFWDHEEEPFEDEWDQQVETADNITLLANSFTEFVAGVREYSD